MRRYPLLFGALLLTLIASSTRVIAQVGPDASTDATTTTAPPDDGCIFTRTPVIGAPFSAVAVTSWQPAGGRGAEQTVTAYYYRDSAGRVRVDQFFLGRSHTHPRVLLSADPDGHSTYIVDTQRRTRESVPRGLLTMLMGGGCGMVFVLPVSMRANIAFGRPDPASTIWRVESHQEDAIGSLAVAGIMTSGTRRQTTVAPGTLGIPTAMAMTDERWVSPDLHVLMASRSADPYIGRVEYQLTAVTRGELAADLFEIPTDYLEKTSATVDLCWSNPYAFDDVLHGRGQEDLAARAEQRCARSRTTATR